MKTVLLLAILCVGIALVLSDDVPKDKPREDKGKLTPGDLEPAKDRKEKQGQAAQEEVLPGRAHYGHGDKTKGDAKEIAGGQPREKRIRQRPKGRKGHGRGRGGRRGRKGKGHRRQPEGH